MITRAQALTAGEFHQDSPTRPPQTKAGQRSCYVWRRNGATQTWKTRPDDFRVPVKYGLRQYGQIRQADAAAYHVAADCPYARELG